MKMKLIIVMIMVQIWQIWILVKKKVRNCKMVNEKQGKVYNPRPVYNRKLLRSVIRAGVQKQFGQHRVSHNMAVNFEKIRKEQVK